MISQTIIIYAGIAVIWWLFAWLYCDYRLDLLRFRLFLVRDRLFAYAEQGLIDFDSPAYLLTRTMINGSLRFAHRLTLTDLLIMSMVQKKYNPNGGALHHERLEKALHGLTFEQKRTIAEIHLELHITMIRHIANVSILLFPLSIFAKIALRLHLLHRHSITKRTRNKLEPIDAVIYDLGSDSVPMPG